MTDPQTLTWPAAVATAVADEARRTYPDEACGLLFGLPDGQPLRAVAIPNGAPADQRPVRYLLSPGAYRRAEQQARSDGLEVVGVFHSHPDHPAEPSATDLAEAWPGWIYVIVPVERGRPGPPRAWRLLDDRRGFVTVPLSVHA